jgi:hypothetical protein
MKGRPEGDQLTPMQEEDVYDIIDITLSER